MKTNCQTACTNTNRVQTARGSVPVPDWELAEQVSATGTVALSLMVTVTAGCCPSLRPHTVTGVGGCRCSDVGDRVTGGGWGSAPLPVERLEGREGPGQVECVEVAHAPLCWDLLPEEEPRPCWVHRCPCGCSPGAETGEGCECSPLAWVMMTLLPTPWAELKLGANVKSPRRSSRSSRVCCESMAHRKEHVGLPCVGRCWCW